MTGSAEGPEIDLIRDSFESATAKLQFLRIAFGTGGLQPVALAEMGRLAADMRRGTRAAVTWMAEGTAPRGEVRLAFLILLCLERALTGGGHASVGRDDGGWTLFGESDALRVEPSLWSMLEGTPPPQDLDGGRVQFALVHRAAAALGASVDVQISDRSITVRVDHRRS